MFDAQVLFSDDQAITATANSTNVIDQGAIEGDGNFKIIAIKITEAFNTLTTLNVTLESDDNAAMSSAKDEMDLVGIPLASLTLGASFQIPIPANTQRYLRLAYTVVGTDPTTGEIFSGIVTQDQTNG